MPTPAPHDVSRGDAGAPVVTDEMVEAGVEALQQCGYGNEPGEPMDLLRSAAESIFLAMAGVSHPCRKSLDTKSKATA